MKTSLKILERGVGVLEIRGAIVVPDGRSRLRRDIDRVRRRRIRHLVVDLREATMVNGSGIGLLLFLRRMCTHGRRTLRLVGGSDRLRVLMAASRLENHLPLHRTFEDAVAAIRRMDRPDVGRLSYLASLLTRPHVTIPAATAGTPAAGAGVKEM